MTITKTKARRGRPPNVEREFTDTREALLRSGMEMLTEQGFATTGIDAVLKRINVPKGSFYNYFKNKEAFGQEVLQQYALYFARKLDHCFLNEQVSPMQRISDFVEDAKSGMIKHEFRRGCLVGNLGQEIVVLPHSFRCELENILLDWQGRLAVQQGQVHPDSDCDELAAFFWIGWEGAVLRAKLTQDVSPLDTFFRGFVAGIQK